MNLRSLLSLLTGIMLIAWASLLCAADNDKQFKLKQGAKGMNCLKCHNSFQDKLARKFVHTPLKKKECDGCHNPHTSKHGKLLADSSKNICTSCHKSIITAKAVSTHKVVAEGNCMKCHDPHSAAFKNNLTKEGKQLCISCHKKLGERLAKNKFKHSPVESNCLTCHLAHSSDKGPALLKNNITALCIGCHPTNKPIFIKKHMNYPMEKSLCTGCHNPHGSDMMGLLKNTVHSPVAKKMCNQCHEDATSANPLKTRKQGALLCRGCHNDMQNKVFDKKRIHWPLLSKQACLGCHNPHASDEKALVRAPLAELCGKCHQDTMKRQANVVSKHEPVIEGRCTDCHDAHSSNSLFLTKRNFDFDLCATTCHDWSKHSTHPIGEKLRDPRNKNLTVSCASCHKTHGTAYKKMLHFNTTTELCIQCHEKFAR